MCEESRSDPEFEPQKRRRSCTWPLPRPESIPEEEEEDEEEEKNNPARPPAPPRKSSARRNAWGNASYAELITRAIQSSAHQRLTLPQIYHWMTSNVPYFRDKSHTHSSAGWKNSIRHNLSLHSRFVRVQNEGPGKSSWWLVSPEGGNGGKAPRRRAVSMDNSSRTVRSARGRAAQKKAVSLQAAADGSSGSSSSLSRWSGSPPSHSSEELDAWTHFRSRTDSNASTLSARLSPIPANPEQEEPPDEAPPSSPCSPSPPTELPRLADLAGTMNLNDQLLDDLGLTASPGRDEGVFGSALRQSPMQTIQENKQATFSCGSPLQDLQDVLLTRSDPLMSQASTSRLRMTPPCGWTPFRSSSLLDLEALGGSLDCDVDLIARNHLMDAEGLEFCFDSFDDLISTQNAKLGSGSFSATKARSAQSWVPG